jgi:predicted ATPase
MMVASQSPARIVITGAPASGKTAFLRYLADEPEFADVTFFPELARELLEAHPHLRRDQAGMHTEIYRRQTAREEAIAGRPFITDRGTLDAFAFHPETAALVGTTISREYRRYTAVIHLGSAAALGEAYYQTDTVRQESIPEALAIEAALRRVWQGHPAYRFIPAEVDIERKRDAFIAAIREAMLTCGSGESVNSNVAGQRPTEHRRRL